MVIEEKAKAYDKALERAKEVYSVAVNNEEYIWMHFIESVFPELGESEDERIRKNLMGYIRGVSETEVCKNTIDQWIAWLEKQGEHTNFRNKIQVGDKVTRNEDGLLVNLSQLDRVAKQGEQKPADKVEPKFKVGDWVVFNDHHCSIYKVEKIENYQYTLRHILGGLMPLSFSSENLIRLWSIQDAKDGDVLVANNKPFIYNEYLEEGRWPFGYGGINIYDRFEKSGGLLPMTHGKVSPATEEQRDLLFSKMKEVGYEWDAEKKELREILSDLEQLKNL